MLRLILDSFPGLAAYVNRDFRYEFTNRTYEDWFGAGTDFTGKTVEEVAGEAIWQAVRPLLERAFSGEKVAFETRHEYRADLVRDVETSYIPDIDEHGSVQGVVVLIMDVTARKAAEQATRQSEERYRALVEASAQYVWITDARGTTSAGPVDWWNDLTGQPADKQGDWFWLQAIHPDDRQRVERAWCESVSNKAPFAAECRLRTRGGQYRNFSARGVPIWNSNGGLREFVGTLTDITGRKQEEEARAALERQLMLLIEASGTLFGSPDAPQIFNNILALAERFVPADAFAIWRKAQDGSKWQIVAMTGLSQEYSRHALTSESEAPAEPIVLEDTRNPIWADEDRSAVYASEGIRSLIVIPLKVHGGMNATLAFYYRQPHHFDELEIRSASALGKIAGAALAAADLYAREAELRRRAQEQEARALFLADAGETLSSSLDYEATLKRVAEMAVPFFANLTAIDLLKPSGEVRRVVVHGQTQESVDLAYEFRKHFPVQDDDLERIALRTGQPIMIENISDESLVARSRGPQYLEILRKLAPKSLICVPLVAGNRSFGIISFLRLGTVQCFTPADLALAEELAHRAATAVENARLFTASQQSQAALKKANEELRKANEDLNQFAYSASHDLQEPLRILSVYSQLLERDYSQQLNGTAREYLGFLVEGSRRMQMLLRDLLAYIQATGASRENVTTVDTNAVVKRVVENLKKRISESQAEIVSEALPELRMEEVHLVQLLQNLIGNAIKYRGDAPPRIEISAERAGDDWLFRVKDNGIGIPPRYHSQVFGIFKRLHTREQYPGTGIGLAICQKIVERYGGRIWVESAEGSGSTFLFKLPACRDHDSMRP